MSNIDVEKIKYYIKTNRIVLKSENEKYEDIVYEKEKMNNIIINASVIGMMRVFSKF